MPLRVGACSFLNTPLVNLLWLLHFVPGRTTIMSLVYAWNGRKKNVYAYLRHVRQICFRLADAKCWNCNTSLFIHLPHSESAFAVITTAVADILGWLRLFVILWLSIFINKTCQWVQFAQGCFIVTRVPCITWIRFHNDGVYFFRSLSLFLSISPKIKCNKHDYSHVVCTSLANKYTR